MVAQATTLKKVAATPQTRTADYFGLQVEIVERLETYSLIRYGNREVIVSTQDLLNTGFES